MWSPQKRTFIAAGATAVGARGGGGESVVELQYRYQPHGALDAKQERRPLVVAWTTLPRDEGQPHAFHRHKLVASSSSTKGGGPFAPVRVSFPYAEARAWPQDACVRFLLMSEVQSSEGQWTYEKAASTEVYLADLMSAKQREQTVAMRVQSYYMPPPGQNSQAQVEAERHKGDLSVRIVAHDQYRSVRWAEAGEFDLTPANAPVLQAAMMLSVTRSMSVFEPGIVGNAMPPTPGTKINYVHAPLYVQETQVALGGETFWSRTSDVARDHVDHHGGQAEAERYLEVLLRQSMARHNMSEQEFLDAAAVFGRPGRPSNNKVSDAQLRKAVAVVATAFPMRVNMMRYVSDKAVLARSKRAVVVESFDQVDTRTDDSRDSGGASSYDVGINRTKTVAKTQAAVDEATGGAMDCEDGARDAAVHFALIADPGAGLPDSALRSEVVKSARLVAGHYAGMGVLSSVLSRNLGDSQQQGPNKGPPGIGTAADGQVEVGAHMFTLLVPKRVLHANVHRALRAKGVSGARVDLGEAAQGLPPSPLASGQELPIALCEGTGILHPFMLAQESYAYGHRAKVETAVAAVLEQEGQVRLRTAHSSTEIAEAAAEQAVAMEDAVAKARRTAKPGTTVVVQPPESSLQISAPAALDRFTPMHTQERVVGDREQRIVSSFYRTPAELYRVPTAAELEARRRRNQGRPHQLVGDRMIPVQIGSRSSDGASQTPYTWGLALSDILRQRSFVGFLPTTEPSPTETRIVDRVHSHVAPAVALHLDEHLGSDRYLRQAMHWSDMMAKECELEPAQKAMVRLRRSHTKVEVERRYALIHAYAHPRDLDVPSVLEMGHWLRTQNPHVVAASVVLERSTYHLGMVRLDAVVDCGGTAELAEPKLDQMIAQKRVASAACLPSGAHAVERVDSFRAIMKHHIRLTVDYVVASWRNRDAGTDLPLSHPTVQALLQQFGDWAREIDEQASSRGRERATKLARRAGYGTPGEYWAKKLVLDHTVYAKNLADAWWRSAVDAGQEAKRAEALANITGDNNRRIAAFWAALLDDKAAGIEAGVLWGLKGHLGCTAKYMGTLARTNDDGAGSEFRRDVDECLALGARFGNVLDRCMTHRSRPVVIGTEIRSTNISVTVQGGVYALNGQSQGRLVMRHGSTYHFRFDSKVAQGNHPLYLTTSSVGNADGQQSILTAAKMREIRAAVDEAAEAGTGGSFTIKPAVDVMVPAGARGALYYQCAVHHHMGGELVFVA